MDLANKTAIVTGGASGLGNATCRELVKYGANVMILDINEDAAKQAAAELGDSADYVATDVTSEVSVQGALETTMDRFGALHICVNCAGGGPPGKTLGRDGPLPLERYASVVNLNLIGTFNVLRLAAEQMARNEPEGEAGERGVVINTASVAAYDGQIGQAAYSSSKAGICGLTLPVARDLAPLGIRVMTIAPGIMNTPLLQGLDDKVKQPLIEMVQFPKRLGLPEEFGILARHIVENAYLNGEVIRLDGAIRMQPR
ncbi:3-hydroxyacyl-CoA dehydrogenase [Lentisalinibacter sediminis]|uniref:3-hydroxyacyl-CoA dehydrogenase n=1 Tax=Lentisalinibacter sediminis TaxID=2992237 RepID=UPI00386BBFEA